LTWAKQCQPRYLKLAYYLQQGEWRKADHETYLVMVAVGDRDHKGYLDIPDIQQFPCEDLRIIDQLWLKYSEGRFGFSVQKQIYVDCGATRDDEYPGDKIWYEFCDRVGWRKDGNYLNYRDLKANPSWATGEFPGGWGRWRGAGNSGLSLIRRFFSRIETCKL
jgi:hypothetical protein